MHLYYLLIDIYGRSMKNINNNSIKNDNDTKYTILQRSIFLIINVLLAIVMILGNKAVFTNLKFKYPIALTTIHYIVTWIGVESLRRLEFYKQVPYSRMPLNDFDIAACIALAVVGVPLNNLSLRLNGVGTYQLLKLLVTPGICILNYLILKELISLKRSLILVLVCVGIAIATMSDLELRLYGLVVALIFVPVAAIYKVQFKRVLIKFDMLSVLHRVYPPSIVIMIVLSLLFDPPGLIMTYEYTFSKVIQIIISGVLACGISLSSFHIVYIFSPLTHQILGLLKVSLTILGGWLIFSKEITQYQMLGSLIAVGGISWYTYETMLEKGMLQNNQVSSLAPQRKDERV